MAFAKAGKMPRRVCPLSRGFLAANHMHKYPASSPENASEPRETPGAADLEFPIDQDFLSRPPQVDLQAMLRRIAETMPFQSTRPGEPERRAATKVDVEFVL